MNLTPAMEDYLEAVLIVAKKAYLLHYDAYINSLVMYDEVGSDGQLHSYIDEDMKIQVQMKIVDALQNKWRKLI